VDGRSQPPIALVDELVTMVFIWLGVGNVLSVIYPLRHEPMAARVKDGTWKPFLFSFVLSYGVGLTVNFDDLLAPVGTPNSERRDRRRCLVAFLLVLASAILS
jgi:hypothetical protein